jgi:hypothetical protein
VEFESETDGPVACEVCSREYSNARYLRRHMIENHIGPHKCEFCLKNYMEERNLEAHVRAKHPERFAEYELKRDSNGAEMRVLLDRLEIPKCVHCEQSFYSHEAQTRHETNCLTNHLLCTKCGSRFAIQQDLLDHDRLAHPVLAPTQEFTCSYCPASYSIARSLKIHHSFKHPELPFVGHEIEESQYVCNYCLMTYANMKSLKSHHTNKHNNLPFVNPMEPGGSTSEVVVEQRTVELRNSSLEPRTIEPRKSTTDPKAHELKKPAEEQILEPQEFPCPHCDKSYNAMKSLRFHITTKHTQVQESTPEPEPEVPMRNLQPRRSAVEKRTEKPAEEPAPEPLEFPCSHCDKSYNALKGLRFHMTTKHPNESHVPEPEKEPTPEPEPEPEPEIPVTRNLQLSDSYEVLDDKNVRCLQCKKTMQKKNFKKHFSSHGTVGKYHCDFCTWDFTGGEFLRNHMRQEHPDKLLCKFCGIQVRNKNLLEAHEKTHADDEVEEELGARKLRSGTTVVEEKETNEEVQVEAIQCKLCEREFLKIWNYNRHMKMKHPEQVHEGGFEFITPDEMERPETPRTREQSREKSQPPNQKELLYTCDVCDLAKTRRDYVKSHMKTDHPGEFVCPVCPHQHIFGSFFYLRNHLKEAHPKYQVRN